MWPRRILESIAQHTRTHQAHEIDKEFTGSLDTLFGDAKLSRRTVEAECEDENLVGFENVLA